jgi:soluble lytic murein transglycosylase-like protein
MEQLWVTNIFDPVQNMFLGTHLLVDLGINEDMRKALATYNGGPRRPAEAYAYADEVIDIYNNLKFQREVLETRAILEEDLL